MLNPASSVVINLHQDKFDEEAAVMSDPHRQSKYQDEEIN